MKDLKLDRRHMLSGGLALGSTSLVSAKAKGMSLARVRTASTDKFVWTRDDIEIVQTPELIEAEDALCAAAEHAPFRAAFLAWLDEARERFALPVSAQIAGLTETVLHTPNLHPALSISLSYNGGIGVFATWRGVFWDILTDLDVFAKPTDDGAGWHDETVIPEYKQVYPTREACWRDVGFEWLLDWFNNQYAPATHLVLFGSEGSEDGSGWTSAHLAREGILLRKKFTIEQNGPVRHLLPLHQDGES